jgi:N4-gp56 family major capsid protein
MAGQVWAVSAEGGYLYSDELSEYLRAQAQPLTKFRQLCDAEDGSMKGLNRGEKFYWNTFSNIGAQGRRLDERQPMPESGVTLSQKSLTVYEAGNSIPYTGKLEALGKQDIRKYIDRALRDDARKYFDIEAFAQFKRTLLRVAPTSGTSTTAITLTTNGATATTNNVELRSGHIKALSDTMKERNVPAFTGGDYAFISHPSTYRTFKNDLESVKQYTETGLGHIFEGEIGRYEGFRFVEQTFIPKGGADDSTTFDPYTNTADAWNNAKSSWGFALGGDTVTEAIVVPEEIRAKIPGDFGRSKGIAWYYLGGFGLVHDDATDGRVFMWDSAA